MCRLFAMSGGREPVSAEVWLLDAPDSLAAQSHKNPDGTGLGVFDAEGHAHVHKQPIAAYQDIAFACEARSECSRTFIGHIRFATTGALSIENTHPFEQDGRLFAHNGELLGLAQLEAELGEDLALVKGQTDSERMFALITRETRRRDGDVRAGIIAAVGWIAEHLPVYSLNLIVATPSDLFALRYPEGNTLFVLERAAGGPSGAEELQSRSSLGTRLHSQEAAERPIVVLASEPMDADAGWRALASGELLHVDRDLRVESQIAFAEPPRQQLSLKQLGEHDRAAQSSPSAG
jgi:glutamine amidotransferase